MNEAINLREEAFRLTHRWPVVLVFCLVGVLISWGISILWPSSYRAAKEVYIGLNAYRALSDRNAAQFANVQFNNLDDYKNWQMANLNAIVKSEMIMEETLRRLQSQDSYWQEVSQSDLSDMLRVYWRNAGKWRLVAESRDPVRAVQAVTAWHEVILERVRTAIRQSQQVMILDGDLQAINTAQAGVTVRRAEIDTLRAEMQNWLDTAIQWPADRTLSQDERWLMKNPLLQDSPNFNWQPLLDAFPSSDAPAPSYVEWLNRVMVTLDSEIQSLQAQMTALETQKALVVDQYQQASQNSFGLSANLQIERISDDLPQPYPIRPTGLLVFVGCLLGLLFWMMLKLTGLSLR